MWIKWIFYFIDLIDLLINFGVCVMVNLFMLGFVLILGMYMSVNVGLFDFELGDMIVVSVDGNVNDIGIFIVIVVL